jgi:hypothetical protein
MSKNIVKIRFYISDGSIHNQSRNSPPFMEPERSLRWSQKPAKSEARCNISYHDNIFAVRVVSLLADPKAGGPPPVSNPLQLIQYIRSYHPCLKAAVSFINNPRTFHAVVTRYQLDMDTDNVTQKTATWNYASNWIRISDVRVRGVPVSRRLTTRLQFFNPTNVYSPVRMSAQVKFVGSLIITTDMQASSQGDGA